MAKRSLKFWDFKELKKSHMNAGFQIDYEWQPEGEGTRAVFIVAKKKK